MTNALSDPVSAARRLLPVVATYLPVPVAGTILTVVYDVPAHPGGDPLRDAVLLGTAATPPLVTVAFAFLAAALARRAGVLGVLGTIGAGAVGLAFLGGATINLPNDLEAARSVDFPVALSIGLAAYTVVFAAALLAHVVAALAPRLRRAPA